MLLQRPHERPEGETAASRRRRAVRGLGRRSNRTLHSREPEPTPEQGPALPGLRRLRGGEARNGCRGSGWGREAVSATRTCGEAASAEPEPQPVVREAH